MTGAVVDDLSRPHPATPRGTDWSLVSDRVMGGVSVGAMDRREVAGRTALAMTGDVRLDNDGGFFQLTLDLAPGGASVDAGSFDGIALTVRGNGADYNVHLRTDAVDKSWQSYRATFHAGADWTTLTLPFADFTPHRIDAAFDPAALRRIGLVAIGRAFHADLAVCDIRFV